MLQRAQRLKMQEIGMEGNIIRANDVQHEEKMLYTLQIRGINTMVPYLVVG